MPEILENFLKSLEDYDANVIWEWLDSNPSAINDMCRVIAKQQGHSLIS